jgi:hypothetical protein
MNLLQIRTQFAKISGRYDLVNPSTFADAGADFYIQQGQRSLERRLNINPTVAKFYNDLTTGQYKVSISNCRAIQEVWILSSESRTEVKRLGDYDLRAIHQQYVSNMYTSPLSTMETGRPSHYYLTNLRRTPEDNDGSTDSSTISSYIDTSYPYDPASTGIILFPRCDEAYGIEIKGIFYSPILSSDEDSNVWASNYPTLLIWSALRELEIMFRGSKTASSWESLIEGELVGIEKDAIEQEINSIDTLEDR